MRAERFISALGEIDDGYVEKAAGAGKIRSRRGLWVSVAAACLVLAIGCAAFVVDQRRAARWRELTAAFSPLAAARVPEIGRDPEDMADFEKFPVIAFDGREYVCRGTELPAERLGDILGSASAGGRDYGEAAVELRAITNISQSFAVAVRYESGETWYTAVNTSYRPASFRELADDLDLRHELRFGGIERSVFDPVKMEHTASRYENADPERLWKFVERAAEGKLVPATDIALRQPELWIEVSIPLVGERVTISVLDGGYLNFSVPTGGRLLYIGEKSYRELMDYILNECEERREVEQVTIPDAPSAPPEN